MKKNYPIMWVEGMPISQHVFQQENLFNLKNLNNLFSAISPNNYGIIEIEWNTSQLNNDILYLSSLKAIMPNFLFATIDESDEVFINLNSVKNTLAKKDLYIFLNISKSEASKMNNNSSYSHEIFQQEVQDLNNQQDSAVVNFAKPCYFLTAGETSSVSNISIALCKINFNGINLQLSAHHPPVLKILNNKELANSIELLVAKIKNKFFYLKNKKSHSFYKEMSTYILLKIIYSLENALLSNIHPEELFKILNNFLAESMFFKSEKDLLIIQKYKHEEYYELIMNLVLYINNAIDNICESYIQTRFIKNDNYFESVIKNTKKGIIIGIKKDENASLQETINWIESAVICKEHDLIKLKSQRAIGYERNIIENFKEFNINEIEGIILIKIEAIDIEEKIIITNEKTFAMPDQIFLFSQEKENV